MVIAANRNTTVTVVYNSIEEGDFSGIMQIYSNDPDSRLVNVNVIGSRFAPNYMEFAANDVFILDEQKMDVKLDNYDNINGFQFDIKIPTKKINKITTTVYKPSETVFTPADTGKNLSVECRQVDEQTYRYFCFFLNGGDIPQGKNTIMRLNFTPTEALELGTCTFTISNIKLSTPDFTNKYAGASDIPVAFNVIKKTQEIALSDFPTMTYGDNPFTLPTQTTDGFDIVWNTDNQGVVEIDSYLLSIKRAGTTRIVATQAGGNYYEPLTKEFTLTIAKSMLTVTTDDYFRMEGEANPNFSISYDGFKYEDTMESLIKQPTISTKAKLNSAPGNYEIIISGGLSDCYEFNYINGTLTVIAKEEQTLYITSIPEMTYGDDYYLLPDTTSSGLPLTWSLSDSSVASIEGNKLNIQKAGTTTLTAKQEGDTTHKTFTEVFTVVVKKVMLNVTVQDTLRYEGEKNPEFSLIYEGFVLGENESVLTAEPVTTCDADENSPTGVYDITLSGGKADNYDFNYFNGILTINEKPHLKGDVNEDGYVNINDVVAIINHIAGTTYWRYADVNEDTNVNINDVVAVINIMAGI